MKIFILGAGSFVKEIADLCNDLGWRVEAFIVDVDSQPDLLLDRPVFHIDDLPSGLGFCVPGIISPKRRRLLGVMVEKGWRIIDLVHPSASVSKTARLDGVVVNRGAVIGRDSWLEAGTIINRGASIGHDCHIGACSTIGPGANLAGNVTVGIGATIGMGANIREGVLIGPRVVVGMGSVVLHDILEGVWWGNPAKRQR